MHSKNRDCGNTKDGYCGNTKDGYCGNPPDGYSGNPPDGDCDNSREEGERYYKVFFEYFFICEKVGLILVLKGYPQKMESRARICGNSAGIYFSIFKIFCHGIFNHKLKS